MLRRWNYLLNCLLDDEEENGELNVESKLFVVTYVGLSDDDGDANGYCDPDVFNSREKAQAHMRELADRELKDMSAFDPEIVEDSPTHIRIQWSGGHQELRLQLHEVSLKR